MGVAAAAFTDVAERKIEQMLFDSAARLRWASWLRRSTRGFIATRAGVGYNAAESRSVIYLMLSLFLSHKATDLIDAAHNFADDRVECLLVSPSRFGMCTVL
jgi:hypothetical protein